MGPEERAALEHQVDRHLRRGELGAAALLLRRLADAFPADAGLAARAHQLEESLEPAERRRVAAVRKEPTGEHKSPMHQAEALAASGHYADAITIYRALLVQKPDSELIKERLAELFQLAQVATPARPEVNRAGVLEHLLDRISSRRRS